MKLKTSPTTAIEYCRIQQDNSLELLGCEPLSCVNHVFACSVKSGGITNEHTFAKIFGPDVLFFYALEQIKDQKLVSHERGLGYLNAEGRLVRHIPIAIRDKDGTVTPCTGSCPAFRCTECDHFIVYSTVPITYAECLVTPNSLITSVAPFHPHSFEVTPDTVVARVGDQVEAVSFQHPRIIELLVSAVTKFTKQMVLKTSKLCVKALSTSVLYLKKSSKTGIGAGGLILDEDGNLKFYDGNRWKTLVWKEDEDEDTF